MVSDQELLDALIRKREELMKKCEFRQKEKGLPCINPDAPFAERCQNLRKTIETVKEEIATGEKTQK